MNKKKNLILPVTIRAPSLVMVVLVIHFTTWLPQVGEPTHMMFAEGKMIACIDPAVSSTCSESDTDVITSNVDGQKFTSSAPNIDLGLKSHKSLLCGLIIEYLDPASSGIQKVHAKWCNSFDKGQTLVKDDPVWTE